MCPNGGISGGMLHLSSDNYQVAAFYTYCLQDNSQGDPCRVHYSNLGMMFDDGSRWLDRMTKYSTIFQAKLYFAAALTCFSRINARSNMIPSAVHTVSEGQLNPINVFQDETCHKSISQKIIIC